MLMKSLDRLEETLDLETAALTARDLTNLEGFNRRKSQSLLEVSRLVRAIDETAVDMETTQRLRQIRAKLERNQEILQRHMQAVQEVASILSNAIRNSESDGTYSAAVQRIGAGA
jgi:vacuolar-type H+-ATPase subunit E/Vma4